MSRRTLIGAARKAAVLSAAFLWFLIPGCVSAQTSVSGGISVGGSGWGVSVGGGTGGGFFGGGGFGGMGGGFGGMGGGSFLAPVSLFASQAGLSSAPISVIIMAILSWLLVIVGFLGVVAFVIAGIFYLVSTGDEDLMDRGKDYMQAAIIGILVALIGVIIIRAIDSILHASPF